MSQGHFLGLHMGVGAQDCGTFATAFSGLAGIWIGCGVARIGTCALKGYLCCAASGILTCYGTTLTARNISVEMLGLSDEINL